MSTTPEQQKVLSILHRLINHFGFSTFSELADLLEVGRNYPAMWIERGSFPFKIATQIQQQHGLRLDWIYHGIEPVTIQDISNDDFLRVLNTLTPQQRILLFSIATHLKTPVF